MLLSWVAFLLAAASFTQALSPESLLSEPRRGAAVSNNAGTRAIFPSSSYSFLDHKKFSSWNVLDLINGETGELLPDSHIASAQWLPTGSDDAILFTNVTSETGETNIWILPKFGAQNEYKVGTIDGAVDNLKIRKFDDKLRFIFSALSNLDGSLYNEKKAEKPHATGRVYESLFVRHWDTYIRREKSTLFAGSISFKNNNYKLDPELKNLMRAGPADLETPIPPFGGGGDFDFSPDGKLVTFVSKTPGLNPANNTQTLVFLISFESNHPPLPLNTPGEELKNTEGKQFVFPCGASSSPKFSPDSKYVAYLQMKQNGYESDQNKIYLARADTSKEQDIILITSSWDLSPQSITWDSDGKSIYTTADNIGRHKLFKVFVKSGKVETVFQEHTVHDVDVIADGKLLLRISSLTFSPRSFILDTKSSRVTNLHQLIENEEIQSQIKVEDFWFPGANDTKVHGFIVKPSYFGKESITKYKFALFIHGGPQGAWNDGWSTRWNPAVFAEYGYIVVAVNPTGSTGYGQKFVDDIQGQWGGKPYIDLEKAMEYLQNNPAYEYLDFNNAVALGASYGGYMINYIAGKPLGRKFKALVCHDGVFSTLNQISSEEIYFPQQDFEGLLWTNREGYEKWDPARLVENWVTPHMIIHGELDYRLPVSEGLAAFNALQLRGVPSKFLHFIDENHWVLNPENSLLWHNEVLEWLNRWTMPDLTESPSAGPELPLLPPIGRQHQSGTNSVLAEDMEEPMEL